MANINDIVNANSYHGQADAGGALGLGVTIDTAPLQRLANFTYYRDKDKWEQKQKDDAVAAQSIANIAAFDVNSPFKQYTDDLTKEVTDLQNYIRENPNAIKYDPKNPQQFIDLQEKIGKIENKRKHATANDALYNAAKAKIELMPNKEDRDTQMELLDLRAKKLFANGVDDGYRQQFEASPEIKPQDYTIPTIPLTETYTVQRNPNDTEVKGRSFAELDRLDALADAAYFGLTKEQLDTNSPAFKALSPDEQKRTLLESKITSRERTNLDNITNSVNGLIKSYKETHETPETKIKIADIPDDALADSGSIGSFIQLTRTYNKQVDEINSLTGKKYSHVNLDDGATPQEIIKLQSFSKAGETLFKELKPTVQQTDNAIQTAHNRATEQIGWYNAKTGRIQEDRLKDAANKVGVPAQSALSAAEYAKSLMGKLNSLKDKEGKISKENLSKLTSDELKYLGNASTVESKFSLTPLDLTAVSNIKVEEDGTIKVFAITGKDKVEAQQGGAINIATIATNKLGDEMVTTTGKEGYNFNTLIPLYQGPQTQKEAATTTELSTAPTDWKKEGNNWRYKDGTLYDAKGNKIKK